VFDNQLLSAFVLMFIVSWLCYRMNLQVLAGGQKAAIIWMGVGVPIFVVTLALAAAMLPVPQSYSALGALVGVGNGLFGLGLKLLVLRRGTHSL
jgi:hypothetical protein